MKLDSSLKAHGHLHVVYQLTNNKFVVVDFDDTADVVASSLEVQLSQIEAYNILYSLTS